MTSAEDIFLNHGQPDSGVFDPYMADLVREPLWSSAEPLDRRIPFKDAEMSRRDFADEFNSPGCYVFGVGDQFIYVGLATRTLWKRLRGRYFIGPKTQHGWAIKYEQQLIEQGIDGFPHDVVEEYQKSNGWVRLEGAVAFARAGVNNVWLHLLPMRTSDNVSALERILIKCCNSWNARRGYDRMLNIQL